MDIGLVWLSVGENIKASADESLGNYELQQL
jgi:hypothetical protein